MEIGEIYQEDENGGEYEIHGAPIRGYDWKIVRHIGRGTYAYIADGELDGDDEDYVEIVVEEFDDPEQREFWDRMPLLELAESVHEEIMRYLS